MLNRDIGFSKIRWHGCQLVPLEEPMNYFTWEQYSHLQKKANRLSIQAAYAKLLNLSGRDKVNLLITKIVDGERVFIGELNRKITSGLEVIIPKEFVDKHKLTSDDQLVITVIPV